MHRLSQAPYWVSEGLSNLMRYVLFLIDSPLSFIAERRYSPYCLLWRVATPRSVYSGELHMYELCAKNLGYHLVGRVKLSVWFTTESRYKQI
jgi:hypothetical protein